MSFVRNSAPKVLSFFLRLDHDWGGGGSKFPTQPLSPLLQLPGAFRGAAEPKMSDFPPPKVGPKPDLGA